MLVNTRLREVETPLTCLSEGRFRFHNHNWFGLPLLVMAFEWIICLFERIARFHSPTNSEECVVKSRPMLVLLALVFACGVGSGWILREAKEHSRDIRLSEELLPADLSQDITIWSVTDHGERMRKFRPVATTVTRNGAPVTTRLQSHDPETPLWIIKFGEQEAGGVQIFAFEVPITPLP